MTTVSTTAQRPIPIMLWIGTRRDDAAPVSEFGHLCEVLIADTIENGVEMLLRQPVDILLVNVNAVRQGELALINEITRCWPYLLCMVLSEETRAESIIRLKKALTPVNGPMSSYERLLDQVRARLYKQNTWPAH